MDWVSVFTNSYYDDGFIIVIVDIMIIMSSVYALQKLGYIVIAQSGIGSVSPTFFFLYHIPPLVGRGKKLFIYRRCVKSVKAGEGIEKKKVAKITHCHELKLFF